MDFISPKDGDDDELKEKDIIKVFAPIISNGETGSQSYKSITLTPELSTDFILGYALRKFKIMEPLSKFSLILVINQSNGKTCCLNG
jgi:hypothetical protein